MALPANISQLQEALKRTQNFVADNANAETYIKMDKGGYWTIGSEELEVEADSEWAINPESFATGYSAFSQDGQRLGEEMALLTAPAIITAELPHVNASWVPQIGMQAKCLSCPSGEDVGKQGLIYQRSRSGMAEMGSILDAMMQKINAGDEACIPVVKLGVDSYKHKQYGKIYTAVFTIVRWLSAGDQATQEEVAQDDIPDFDTSGAPQIEEVQDIAQEDAPQPARRRRRA